MGKIAFIAPEENTAQLAREISQKIGLDIYICIAKGDERYIAAQKAAEQGAEVAVSRWGFSFKKAQERLEIDVINIDVTSFDIIRTLYKIKNSPNKKRRLSVVHNHSVIDGFLKLASYMDVELTDYFSINSIDSMEIAATMEMLKQVNTDAVISNLDVINTAKKIGIEGIRIETGVEGIEQGLLEAERLIPVKFKEREKANRLKTILDHSHEGIIALDYKNNVTVFNKEAGEILGVAPNGIIGKGIDCLPNKAKAFTIYNGNTSVLEKYQTIGDKHIISNHVPVYVGANKTGTIITFINTERIVSLETKVRKETNKKGMVARYNFFDIIANSKKMQDTIEIARKYSKVDASILIQGETGTGKEMFAQSIHNESLRSEGPFVAINCAAIPESILESELFGYTGGAFTGAKKEGKPGLFELAHNGTIFLDEVGEMPLRIQSRFLRVLQERTVIRIGGDSLIPVNVRVIAATNRDLIKLAQERKFRHDLYFRLAALVLELPPLRERESDILTLFNIFYENYQSELGREPRRASKDIITWLLDYHWPGNIRELKNVAERLVILSDEKGYIPDSYLKLINKDIVKEKHSLPIKEDSHSLKSMEREVIIKALEQNSGNKKLTANALGISTATLWRKLKEISVKDDEKC